MKHDAEHLLEVLAATTHGSLVAGHAISAFYNFRRAKKLDAWVLAHLACAALSAFAVHTHVKRLNRS